MYTPILLSLLLLPFSALGDPTEKHVPESAVFNPRAYPKRIAKCDAVNRAGKKEVATKIDIHYVHVNPTAARTLLLVHGWPSLWSTWGNQIQRFDSDYRLIVPDLRGFGPSTHPGDVESSGTIPDMVGDLLCLLDKERVQTAVCVGHDWGAQICWEAARMRPDRFEAVAGAVVPYLPSAGHFTPVEELSKVLPHLTYQIYFEKKTQKAVEELNHDIRRTLRGTLRSVESPPPQNFLSNKGSFLKAWKDVPVIPAIPFFTEEEEDYMVEQYSIQKFDKTLQFYTHGCRYGSWDFAHRQGNFTINQPALYIAPSEDPVADWPLAALVVHSADFIPNLKKEAIETAHWPQLEKPVKFNDILEEWLNELPPPVVTVPKPKPTAGPGAPEPPVIRPLHQLYNKICEKVLGLANRFMNRDEL